NRACERANRVGGIDPGDVTAEIARAARCERQRKARTPENRRRQQGKRATRRIKREREHRPGTDVGEEVSSRLPVRQDVDDRPGAEANCDPKQNLNGREECAWIARSFRERRTGEAA